MLIEFKSLKTGYIPSVDSYKQVAVSSVCSLDGISCSEAPFVVIKSFLVKSTLHCTSCMRYVENYFGSMQPTNSYLLAIFF